MRQCRVGQQGGGGVNGDVLGSRDSGASIRGVNECGRGGCAVGACRSRCGLCKGSSEVRGSRRRVCRLWSYALSCCLCYLQGGAAPRIEGDTRRPRAANGRIGKRRATWGSKWRDVENARGKVRGSVEEHRAGKSHEEEDGGRAKDG